MEKTLYVDAIDNHADEENCISIHPSHLNFVNAFDKGAFNKILIKNSPSEFLKAKGLLSIMLSLPNGWNYSIEGLIAICKEGEKAVVSALDELKKNKYLVTTKLYPNQTKSKRIEYIYDIFENPKIEKQDPQNVGLENGRTIKY